MSALMPLIHRLSGMEASPREEVVEVLRRFVKGEDFGGSVAPTFSPPAATGSVAEISAAYAANFADIAAPDGDFFSKVLNAAQGNQETAIAVLDIIRQQRERGEWRDESFPAGLVLWFLKNKDHDKLRKQGYAIRKGREEGTTPPPAPAAPRVETAAYTPSRDGLSELEAVVNSL